MKQIANPISMKSILGLDRDKCINISIQIKDLTRVDVNICNDS